MSNSVIPASFHCNIVVLLAEEKHMQILAQPVTKRQNIAATQRKKSFLSVPSSPRQRADDVTVAQRQTASVSPEFELFLVQLRSGKKYCSAQSSPRACGSGFKPLHVGSDGLEPCGSRVRRSVRSGNVHGANCYFFK